MQHLQPNTTLQGGKYRIKRVLGQGGFGITYLAVQTSLNRNVAIKEFFMKDFCSRDEATFSMSAPSTGSGKLVDQYRKKFIKEAMNLAKLNHPNIISVIEVFEENGTVYYVMPYLAGGSLQDYVKTHGTLSETVAMRYIKQIAGALKYMHEEQHICHYDVKPANILLDDKDNAVLIDFGISKNYDAAGQETTTTPVGMSEGYAPIEQYQQNVEEFSPVSDIYALGATLYFLLHGKRPVSAVHRASGTALLMSKQLSQAVKDIITVSMKISKRERAKSVDIFMRNLNLSTNKSYSIINDDDERTIIDNSRTNEVSKITISRGQEPTTSNLQQPEKNNSYIGWIIAAVVIVGFAITFMYKPFSDGPAIDTDSGVEAVVASKPIFLIGKIADNIGFTMRLTINGNIVEGVEHYDNQKKDVIVHIKGTLGDNGTLNLDEYDGTVKTGTYFGLLSGDSYSGTFTNSKGKELKFSSTAMDEEMFNEWNNSQFETSIICYRKNADGINVEIKADYPIRGNEELVGKTRLFVANTIKELFGVDTKVTDLPDGQALLDYAGNIKYGEMKQEKYSEDGSSNGYEETINIQKCSENDKYVSFCATSFFCHGGVGNSFQKGITFRKDDGKTISVFKNSYNTNLCQLIKSAVRKKLGSDYDMLNEDFELSPMPKEEPYLTKNGVQFDYQHYEIGAGALGQISIVVPYESIKQYMSDEARQLVYQ